MIRPLTGVNKVKNAIKKVSVVAFSFVLGGLVVALMLDNRIGAIVKAFNNPNLVNQLQFQVEVVKK